MHSRGASWYPPQKVERRLPTTLYEADVVAFGLVSPSHLHPPHLGGRAGASPCLDMQAQAHDAVRRARTFLEREKALLDMAKQYEGEVGRPLPQPHPRGLDPVLEMESPPGSKSC